MKLISSMKRKYNKVLSTLAFVAIILFGSLNHFYWKNEALSGVFWFVSFVSVMATMFNFFGAF